jgi:NADP-dependent 3-hydroxy acid dehydrogenase YdfG
MDTIAGTVAVVTGGASGIGLGIAQALSSAGSRVALLDVDAESLKRAAASIPDASAFVVDVSGRAAMYETADRVRAALGPVAILVNNAGIAYNRTPLWETADADIDWSFAINVFGVLHGIKAYVPEMVRHGRGGHVVNTSSIGGFQVRPTHDFHQGLYAATKYAVTALSEGLRFDLAPHRIGVSILAPASVTTNIGSSDRNRPDRFGGATDGSQPDAVATMLQTKGISPAAVAHRVISAIVNDEPYVFTHPAERTLVEARHQQIIEAFNLAEHYSERTNVGPQPASDAS